MSIRNQHDGKAIRVGCEREKRRKKCNEIDDVIISLWSRTVEILMPFELIWFIWLCVREIDRVCRLVWVAVGGLAFLLFFLLFADCGIINLSYFYSIIFWLKASFDFGLETVSTFARNADVFGFCGFVYNTTIINLHIFFYRFL